MVLRIVAVALLCASSEPHDGRDILERMHAAYAGRWYSSLAFVQRTTLVRAGGQHDTATWYESLKGPDLLRIDFGDPAAGRGAIRAPALGDGGALGERSAAGHGLAAASLSVVRTR